MKVELGDAVNQVRQQKEEAEDRRGGADPPEQPEIAQNGGLLVLVHSAGRHLSRLLYGQSGEEVRSPWSSSTRETSRVWARGSSSFRSGNPRPVSPF